MEPAAPTLPPGPVVRPVACDHGDDGGRRRVLGLLSGKPGGAGRRPRLLLVIAGIAALWALVFSALGGDLDRAPFAEEHEIAVHLALGHGYVSPLDPSPTASPSAWSPPVYPGLLAASYRLFGIASPRAVLALLLLNALCFGAAAAAVCELATLLVRARPAGIAAAALFSVHPFFLSFARDYWDGMLALAAFLWIAVGAFRAGEAREAGNKAPWGRALLLGAAMGLLLLTNPAYALTCPVLLAVAFLRGRGARRFLLAGVAAAACAAVLAPWTVRNARVFGRLLFVRSCSGISLWVGNEPGSGGWLDEAAYRSHPYWNAAERRTLLELGEPAYDELCVARFRKRYAEDPLRFWTRSAARAGYLLVGNPREAGAVPSPSGDRGNGTAPGRVLAWAAVAALALADLAAASRLGYRAGGLSALMVAAALPFVPTAVIDRYALPLRALLLVAAVSFAWMAAVRAATGRWPRPAPPGTGLPPRG